MILSHFFWPLRVLRTLPLSQFCFLCHDPEAWSTWMSVFFYAVWPCIHMQMQHQVTETKHFWKLLPGWRFSKTPVAVLSCRQRNQIFWLVMSEHALLSPPTGNFFRLLIGQHGFMVEIISPPVGLACSWQCFIACFCVFMWTEICLKMEKGKTLFIKLPVYVWTWPEYENVKTNLNMRLLKCWVRMFDFFYSAVHLKNNSWMINLIQNSKMFIPSDIYTHTTWPQLQIILYKYFLPKQNPKTNSCQLITHHKCKRYMC